jgi:hypothetical protein
MSAIQTTTKIKSAQQAKVVPQDKEEIAKLIHIVNIRRWLHSDRHQHVFDL